MWQNISGENLKLLNSKIISIFGSTDYICERTLSTMSCHASVRVLQTAIRAEFH